MFVVFFPSSFPSATHKSTEKRKMSWRTHQPHQNTNRTRTHKITRTRMLCDASSSTERKTTRRIHITYESSPAFFKRKHKKIILPPTRKRWREFLLFVRVLHRPSSVTVCPLYCISQHGPACPLSPSISTKMMFER